MVFLRRPWHHAGLAARIPWSPKPKDGHKAWPGPMRLMVEASNLDMVSGDKRRGAWCRERRFDITASANSPDSLPTVLIHRGQLARDVAVTAVCGSGCVRNSTNQQEATHESKTAYYNRDAWCAGRMRK
jgi:hypothetical protein